MSKRDLLVIGDITPAMQQDLEPHFNLHSYSDAADRQALIAQKSDQIEAIATNGADGVPDNLISELPHLKIISNYGVGYDAIDVAAAAARGILVTHTPDVLNEEVAVTAVMLLIATQRQLRFNMEWVSSGRWSSTGNAPFSHTLQGLKVGMVGYGRIGQTIASKLEVFGCDIAYHARNQRTASPHHYYDSLQQMAQAVQALIVITPGGPATHHLINADILSALGNSGILVNVARGSVVDEDALVSALQNNGIAGAGLDVFADEPHVPAALLEHPQVICTPHIGSATFETRAAMGKLTTDNLIRFFTEGSVLTPVPETAHLNS